MQYQYVDVREADCLAPRSDVGRDWWPPLVACGPNRTNELAAVLLWREDRRQGVRTTPARREPRALLIRIC